MAKEKKKEDKNRFIVLSLFPKQAKEIYYCWELLISHNLVIFTKL